MIGKTLATMALAAATVAAQPNPNGNLKVDHASICGSSLDSLREAFVKAGLRTEYGGAHASGGTHMAILGFDDGSYLELIAPQRPGGAKDSNWNKFMDANAGPCAWALGVPDAQAEIDRLKKAGLPAKGPFAGSRRKPDGKVIEWQTGGVDLAGPGAALPFFIEDKTPRSMRVTPSASVKGGALTGIKRVILGVKDQEAAIALLRKAYDLPAPTVETNQSFGAKLAYFPNTSVILATPIDKDSWLSSRLEKFGEAPVAFLLGTKDFASTARGMKLSGEATSFGKSIGWFGGDLEALRLGVVEE